jgi:hypothetical protein
MKKLLLTGLISCLVGSTVAYSQGCIEPSSSASGPQVIGYIQGENISQFKDNDESTNSFSFRRARLGVTGSIPYNFTYYVMTELSPTMGGPYILDAFLTWKAAGNYAKVSAGQFKVPFGLELSTPCQSLFTYDRSLVVNELASPFRDQGIMFSGSTDSLKIFGIEKPNIFSYSLAITNGTGLNITDTNTSKDIVGRLVFAPCNFFQIGGSFHTGEQKNPDATITKADKKTRWGADLQLKKSFGKFGFISQSEYIYGKDEGSKLVGGGCGGTPTPVIGTFKSQGYYSQLMIQTPWKIEPVFKYQSYDPNMDLSDYDATSYRKDSWISGFNYYMNDWTRLQVNYIYNMEGSSKTDYFKYNEYKNDMLVVQLQFILH